MSEQPDSGKRTKAGAAPIYGLVLAGGRSRRMGKDKASLQIHGEPQLQRAARLLQACCQRTFISIRSGQERGEVVADYPWIEDQHRDIGPLGGILAAQNAHQDCAWLVLACDLPFVDELVLNDLIAGRNPDRLATAYRSSENQLPEPLCAIYEPASRATLEENLARGIRCPRKILINSDVALLDLPDPQALTNLNTPADLALALAKLETHGQQLA